MSRAASLSAAAVGLLLAGVTLSQRLQASAAAGLALEALTTSLVLTLLALAGANLSREPVSLRLGLHRGRLRAGTLLLVVFGLVAWSHALEALLRLGELRDSGTLAEIDARLALATPAELAYVVLALGIAPGIGEELFFRGLLQRGLERRLGGLGAVAVAAAAFGCVHVDPVHAGAAFLLGLYLGAVAYWAGSVRAAIACHVVNNVVAVLESALDSAAASGSLLGPALGAAVGGFALLAARRRARRFPGVGSCAERAAPEPPRGAAG